jgi:tetratricopeptide (TPR) repeat protein
VLDFSSQRLHHQVMRVSLLAALFSIVIPALALADATEPQLMAQAQRAYLAGDYDTAKDLFTQVIELDPQNNVAIQFLRRIRLAEAGQAPKPAQDPLKQLLLPKVNFKNATFSAALDYLKQEAAKQSVAVSFVPQLPDAQLQKPITLSLGQIPFLDALTYICQLDGAVYKIDPYAIVITPQPPSAPGGAAPPAQ